jgi:hypothetical protein
MADNFNTHATGLNSPADNAFAITTDDDTDLTNFTRGLYVGVSGDVKVDLVASGTVVFTDLIAGVIHPIRAKRVYATGTTATNIVGLY